MRPHLVILAFLLLATPFTALATTGAPQATPSKCLAPAPAAPAEGSRAGLRAAVGAPQGPASARPDLLVTGTARLASAPLLDLIAPPGVAQAGCGSFTRCSTVADCPCDAPDCACVPSSTCGFNICLCRTYCFGGDPP